MSKRILAIYLSVCLAFASAMIPVYATERNSYEEPCASAVFTDSVALDKISGAAIGTSGNITVNDRGGRKG